MVVVKARGPAGSTFGPLCLAGLLLSGALTAGGCSDTADDAEPSNESVATGGAAVTRGGTSGATSAQGGKAGNPDQPTGGRTTGSGSGGASSAQGGMPGDTHLGGNAGAPGEGGTADPTGGIDGQGGRDSAAGAAGEPGTAGEDGAGGDTGAGGAGGMSIAEFCELLPPRARSWLRTCRFGFGDASGWWGTENIDRFCSTGRAAVAAGRLEYDPVQAAACAADSFGDCETIAAFAYPIRNGLWSTNACAGVVRGTVPTGGECYADSTHYSGECAAGFCGGDTCPGHCEDYVAVGDDCDLEALRCDPAEALCLEGKCTKYSKPGEPCLSNCRPDLLCATELEPETCLERRKIGETCQVNDQCSGSVCLRGKCTDQVAMGEPCDLHTNCPSGAYCDGTCKPRLPLAADCLDTTVPCLENAQCIDGTCQVLGEEGDACPCDYDLWCDAEDRCRTPGELDADCSRADDLLIYERCASPLVCRPSDLDDPTALSCLAQGAEGDPCRPQFSYTCQAPFFCEPVTARCTRPGAVDQPCSPVLALESCQTGLSCRCTSDGCTAATLGPGLCKARVSDGSDCVNNADCSSGSCVAQKCAASTLCR